MSHPGALDSRAIVLSYFPRDLREQPDIVFADVWERCVQCSQLIARAGGVVHVWKVRSGMQARAPLVTLCDRCDAALRPRAYLQVSQTAPYRT